MTEKTKASVFLSRQKNRGCQKKGEIFIFLLEIFVLSFDCYCPYESIFEEPFFLEDDKLEQVKKVRQC